MSVNTVRPKVCAMPGCGRRVTSHGHLCDVCFSVAWNDYLRDRRAYEVWDMVIDASEENTQPVPAFDVECATVFDAQGRELYQAPIRLVRDYSGRANG